MKRKESTKYCIFGRQKNNMSLQSKKNTVESPMQRAWKRLKKNKPAMFSLFLIGIATFLAIFGPALSPDSTPNADDQVLEISQMKPNFSTKMLLVKKNKIGQSNNFFSNVFGGRENDFAMVPINSWEIVGDSVNVNVFRGTELESGSAKYGLADIFYALSTQNRTYSKVGNTITFFDANENKISANISELANRLEKEHIVTKTYKLGTDNYGRDILSRLIYGVRVSLSVGFVAVIISLTIGIFFGAVAGFYRGWVDSNIMWLINVVWAIPTILLAMAINFALGNKIQSFYVIYIAVGLSMWVEVARIVRGQVLGIREMEYVQAARSLGFKNSRIIFNHILPNIIGPIMVIISANFASAILIEAGLSFVGIGVKPPMPSWGTMLNEYRTYLTTPGKTFLALYPGMAIAILVLAFNLLGSGLSDAFDVKGKTNN